MKQIIEHMNIADMDRYQLCKNVGGLVKETISISGESTSWCFGVYESRLHRYGNKFFSRMQRVVDVAYRGGKWYGNDPRSLTTDHLIMIFNYFNAFWAVRLIRSKRGIEKDTYKIMMASKNNLRSIINGNICCEAELWEAAAKRSGIKVSAECYKMYTLHHRYEWPALMDLMAFTPNVDESIRFLNYLTDQQEHEHLTLIKDTIDSAVMLNQVIDITCGKNKIEKIHNQQNVDLIRMANPSCDKDIYSQEVIDYFKYNDVVLVSNEMLCAQLADLMGNCVYTHYWSRINDHKYAAMVFNFDNKFYMLGIRRNPFTNVIELDQLYGRFNAEAPTVVHHMVYQFVMANISVIENILTEEKITLRNPFC